jgi:hypothetical protein
MIHYITSNGIGNAWVANELSRVDAARVPFVLHAMRSPDKLLHGSEWALRMNQQTMVIYPLAGIAGDFVRSVGANIVSWQVFCGPWQRIVRTAGTSFGPGWPVSRICLLLVTGPAMFAPSTRARRTFTRNGPILAAP